MLFVRHCIFDIEVQSIASQSPVPLWLSESVPEDIRECAFTSALPNVEWKRQETKIKSATIKEGQAKKICPAVFTTAPSVL
jgi:hypothetical protein